MRIPLTLLYAHTPERRKGGGSGGRSGGASSGSSGGSSSKSGGSGISGGSGSPSGKGGGTVGPSRGSFVPITSASGSTGTVRPYGQGSNIITTIPIGRPFAGRSVGGGTRDNIYGSRQYGSGYPGYRSSGVGNRGFPFGFWPITFGIAAGTAGRSVLHSEEYGDPNNSSRPGGVLCDAPFQAPDGLNTYRVLSDNITVQELIASITANCSLRTTSISAVPYNTTDPNQPRPEQVIQYYRSSSIALTLDGYNNSAVFSSDLNASDTPLPPNLDEGFLDCLNYTIGAAAPLFDAATPRSHFSSFLGLVLLTLHFLRWIL